MRASTGLEISAIATTRTAPIAATILVRPKRYIVRMRIYRMMSRIFTRIATASATTTTEPTISHVLITTSTN